MKTFNYAPASPIKDQLTMLAVSTGMIVVPLIYPFGLRIGRLRILGPTATTVLFIVGGLVLLAMTLNKVRLARALAAHGCKITVDGDRVTYPVFSKGTVSEATFAVSAVESQHYDEEEGELRITLADGTRIVLDSGFFDSTEQYGAFCALLKK